MARIDNRKDIMLLLLYSPGKTGEVNEPITGRTRLVKMLFLFRKEVLTHFRRGTGITEENFYDFFAWNFGPFSLDVYDDLTFFILRGFVSSSQADEEALPESAAEWEWWLAESAAETGEEDIPAYAEETFRLTEKGKDFASNLYDALSDAQGTLLREFKAKLTVAPLRAILRYVYRTYPETTDRSKIKGESLAGGT